MSRIKVLDYDEMTQEQKALHDEILSGPRKRIGGPMNGWFRSPEFGSLYQKVGAFCRYHTTLEPKLSELAIIIVARHWDQPVEWRAHQPLALEAGLDPAIADAIESHETPEFNDEREEAVYSVVNEALETKKLGQATYDNALAVLGEKTLFELTGIAGYYCSIALQMNCFDVGIPDGTEPRLKGT